jgi:hypothetical protein
MKIGRNDPCPCGSGKKYKKCCLGKAAISVDLLWRRLGEAHDRLVSDLMKYAHSAFGPDGLAEALEEFLLWPDEEATREVPEYHEELFYPWFLFNWIYEPELAETQLEVPEETTIAKSYARKHKHRPESLEARLIEETSENPFSFYEVIECQPGKGYRLKDILRGDIYNVFEKLGSENAHPGDILFARVIQIDQVAMLIGCGSVLIAPQYKPELIKFRKQLTKADKSISPAILNEYDAEIRELYFNIYNAMMQPPELRNTDGDPISFHTIYYQIDSPEVAFDRLKSLSVVESEEELRDEAELDEHGHIIQVAIPWSRKEFKQSKAFDNTILGWIKIEGRQLKIEVNSAQRAEAIRKEVKKRLKKNALYKTTEIKSVESTLADASAEKRSSDIGSDENKNLMQHPEVRQQIGEMVTAHWEDWVDQKIPALEGKTPREAVKTSDGRESVEALLIHAERQLPPDDSMTEVNRSAIKEVRRKLGLS